MNHKAAGCWASILDHRTSIEDVCVSCLVIKKAFRSFIQEIEIKGRRN
jgi:hypothetical protein